MSISPRRAFITLSALLAPAIAQADITADQIWDQYRSYLESFGHSLTAKEERSGDSLTVSDITLEIALPEAEGTLTLRMDPITFTSLANGTVDISVPEDMGLTIALDADDTEDFTADLAFRSSGLSLIASGDAADTTYTYSADRVDARLARLEVDGEVIPPDLVSVSVGLADMAGLSAMRTGQVRDIEQTVRIASATYAVSFADPETEDRGAFRGIINGVKLDSAMTLPLEMNTEDPAALFRAGFAIDANYSVESSSQEMDVIDDGEEARVAIAQGPGSFRLAVDKSRLGYGIDARDVKTSIVSAELPFPVEFTFAALGLDLDTPIGASDGPVPFGLRFGLEELTLSEGIWAMADPSGQLPHDPITAILDIVGKVRLLVDLFDPAAMARVDAGETPPGLLHELEIREFEVSAVGARVTGNGRATFDNTDLATYEGIPKPVGAVDLQIEGINALFDRLIAMGLMPEDQAMGMRMMLSMFAMPAGEDTLRSRIEFNEEGQILANGQRLK